MRRIAVLALLLLAVACGSDDDADAGAEDVGTSTTTTTAAAPATLEVVEPVTDNYKACFNPDPTAFEGRTWLPVDAVVVDDVRYAPPAGTEATTEIDALDGIGLVGSDGSEATLVARTADSATAATTGLFRVGDDGRFGYLGTVRSREALVLEPLAVTLELEVDGAVVAATDATYSLDPVLADAPPGTPEHGGPAGRWSVGGTATPTDFERSPYSC